MAWEKHATTPSGTSTKSTSRATSPTRQRRRCSSLLATCSTGGCSISGMDMAIWPGRWLGVERQSWVRTSRGRCSSGHGRPKNMSRWGSGMSKPRWPLKRLWPGRSSTSSWQRSPCPELGRGLGSGSVTAPDLEGVQRLADAHGVPHTIDAVADKIIEVMRISENPLIITNHQERDAVIAIVGILVQESAALDAMERGENRSYKLLTDLIAAAARH